MQPAELEVPCCTEITAKLGNLLQNENIRAQDVLIINRLPANIQSQAGSAGKDYPACPPTVMSQGLMGCYNDLVCQI